MLKCTIYEIMYVVLFSIFTVNRPNNVDYVHVERGYKSNDV